jgi:helicase MOV-10
LPRQYGEYFSDALQNEIAAQLEELKAFSMYDVAFDVEDYSQQLYGFTIPGLREDSPRVDLGDVVKIRPLTAPPQQQPFLNRGGTQGLASEFSGFEFHAIVWGISRSRERIVLRMDGFMPNLYRTCNVIFTVQEHQRIPLWRSIHVTECSLESTRDPFSPWLRQMLFPDRKYGELQSNLSPGDFGLVWFDFQMNFEQKKAVDAVVTANYGCLPYLVCTIL